MYAPGAHVQLAVDHTYAPQRLSPAKAGSGSLGDVIPGLRSLRSLTRGYHLSPLRGSLKQTC